LGADMHVPAAGRARRIWASVLSLGLVGISLGAASGVAQADDVLLEGDRISLKVGMETTPYVSEPMLGLGGSVAGFMVGSDGAKP
jgi:hypothetical protein